MDWLHTPAEELLDDVIDAKQTSGEDVDPVSPRVRSRVLEEVRRAQADILDEVEFADDGRVLVHRALSLDDATLAALAPGDALGECWAFDERGAHPYDACGKGRVVVVSGLVHPDDIVGPLVLAMWSSGEGEARLHRAAEVELVAVKAEGIGLVRQDLTGTIFRVTIPSPTFRP